MQKYLLVLLLALPHLAYAQQQLFYIGRFKSDEAKTLASMRAIPGIPEKERKAYEKDFFGRLVNDIRSDSFTTYFANDVPASPVFIPAQIQLVSGDTIRMRYYHEYRKEFVERELTFKDGCYTVPVGPWGFEEFFCKLP
ncbi:hypothetical protein WKI13_05570 [Teredinibacter turnerae]|uniref:hypothetical protein n=1 Tax=Teredinibacter turnerae TaxID=2426 RepID=UPI000378199E|nr:hypothetical protein [Teredinibacter turnerae]